MALIVEDGTGMPGAESYNSVADMDSYMLKMGYTDWPQPPTTGDDPDLSKKEAMARRAAKYEDATYGTQFTGQPKTTTQGLAWPRVNAYDYYRKPIPNDIVPQQIKDAHCELARIAFSGQDLAPNISGGYPLKRKEVDALKWEWDTTAESSAPVYGFVDVLLTPLFGAPDDPESYSTLQILRA